MSNLIEVDNVHYSINENNLIRGISFGLKENEICHIQGVNGSGKTSLLKIILGIVEPTKGEVHRKENLKIQFHGHKLPFKGFLTLLQNLKLVLSEDELVDAQKVLEELDLHEKLNLRFSNLSFGQQKKSFFASKLVIKNTQVFVLDEPFVPVMPIIIDLGFCSKYSSISFCNLTLWFSASLTIGCLFLPLIFIPGEIIILLKLFQSQLR